MVFSLGLASSRIDREMIWASVGRFGGKTRRGLFGGQASVGKGGG